MPDDAHPVRDALASLDTWDDARLVGQLVSIAVGTHSARGITVDAPAAPADPVTGDGAAGSGTSPRTSTGTSTTAADLVADVVRRRHLGGVCYFPERPEGDDLDDVRTLVRTLQAAADVPLLVSADQENGTVSRLRAGSTRLPSAMALAAADDPALTEAVAAVSGAELRAVGIRHAFAPVADMSTEPRNPVIGVRSPGADPERVAAQVAASVRGLAGAGVASTLKHFPGHGTTTVDSHLGLPVLTLDRATWEAQEARSFAAGIAAGADAVMIGHLVFPAVDPDAPATYSRAVVTGELRERLGFDGVVVTDALDMAGAGLPGGSGAAAVAALAAGVDQVLMPGRPEEAVDAVLDAVRTGVLDRDALRASARRILTLKLRLALTGDGIDPDAPVGTAEHAATAALAGRRSVLWRDPFRTWVLPAAPAGQETGAAHDGGPLVRVVGFADDPGHRGVDVAAVLGSALTEAGARVDRMDLADVAATAPHGRPDAVVVVTRDAWRDPAQADRLAAHLADARSLGVPACVVASRSPSDAGLVPADVPLLLVLGDVAPSAAAAALVLTGRLEPTGVLPVGLVPPTTDGAA